MMGAFAIVVGFFVIVSGVTQHFLYSESAVVSKPPSTSRLPPTDQHEKVNFVYFCYRGEDYDGPHMMSQSRELPDDEIEDPYLAEQREEELQRQEMERQEQERHELILKKAEQQQLAHE